MNPLRTKRIVKKVLRHALTALFEEQPDIFDFAQETRATEWNLAHHVANSIHRIEPFSQLNCDLEVSKGNENKRPDIIFHKRTRYDDDFLVVEIKFDGSPADVKEDRQKIQSYWFAVPFSYKFGAVINIKRDKTYCLKVLCNSLVNCGKGTAENDLCGAGVLKRAVLLGPQSQDKNLGEWVPQGQMFKSDGRCFRPRYRHWRAGVAPRQRQRRRRGRHRIMTLVDRRRFVGTQMRTVSRAKRREQDGEQHDNLREIQARWRRASQPG